MTAKPQICVTVTKTRGSVPREAGTYMMVTPDGQKGTIGGGTLEWEAARIARDMIARGTERQHMTFPLGPALGQCCGGSVDLEFSTETPRQDHTQPPCWIWGAGHVGRAIAAALAPLDDRRITLVDISADKLPDPLPPGVDPLVATEPVSAAQYCPENADHLILTCSHDLDLALCDALLRQPCGSIGLIGSATKWARFRKRLSALGHGTADISRIACPIGDPALGKHPQAIALGVVTALITPAAQDARWGDIAS